LLGATGAAGLLTAACGYRALTDSAEAATALPAPGKSGIKHIVVVMMENRSFDHFLGWLPGADGKQAGLTYVDRYRVPHDTHHLDVFASCGFNDPDHSYEGGRIQLNGGRCDGWLRSGANDSLSIGYYEQADLSFLGQAVPEWTTFDRYFSAVMAETYPNRFYLHAGRTDRLHNGDRTLQQPFPYPTIWSRLIAKGVSHGYYYADDFALFPVLLKNRPQNIHPFAQFVTDAADGKLPAVTYVDPRFTNEGKGTSNDDHPHADIRAGEDFMNQIYNAVTTSPNWPSTVLVFTYDEWGGFFDHVAPTTAHDVSATTALRGFRVPTMVVSPFARRGYVSHATFDHTSILKMIEWRWGLAPLTPRDRYARNLATALDFKHHDIDFRTYDVPPFTTAGCVEPVAEMTGSEYGEWPAIRDFVRRQEGSNRR
jgi:phospholipase C